MGKKRKRGQTKHSWSLHTISRKQKRRRQTRCNGSKRGHFAPSALSVEHLSLQKLDTSFSGVVTSNDNSLTVQESIPSHHFAVARRSVNTAMTYFGIGRFLSCLFTGAYKLQHLTMGSTIRKVFFFLDWLKRITGCGLQTLGKLMMETSDHVTMNNSQLNEVMNRMESLEKEVKMLKCELAKERSCRCVNQPAPVGCQPPAVPPPPPPPPPPVLPPAPPPLHFLRNKQTGLKDTSSKNNPTKDNKPKNVVTLEDLRKVKLRKVSQQADMSEKENVPSEVQQTDFKLHQKNIQLETLHLKKDSRCVVTLSDIQNVTLKRRVNADHPDVEKLKTWTPEEMKIKRRNLRKVNISRSPGGTPLVSDKNCESGSGLTPMMTKALMRKFKHARPHSPESTAGKRKRKQSLSPLVGSPSTPSPLAMR